MDAQADYVFVTTADVDDESTIPSAITQNAAAFPTVTLVDTELLGVRSGPKGGDLVLDDIEQLPQSPEVTSLLSAPPVKPRSPGGAGRTVLGLVVLAVLLVVAVVADSRVELPSGADDVLQGGGTSEARYVVAELRVPRTVTGLVVGAALGVAGALVQEFTRNPLADPGILGVNAGAAFAVSVGVAFFGMRDIASFVWLAFLGSLIVTVAVYLIGSSGRGAADPIRLTLAGVVFGAVFSGMTTGMTQRMQDAFDQMRFVERVALLGRGFDVLLPVLPFIVVALAGALLLAPGLNALALGEDVARAQGAHTAGIRVGVIVTVTLLAGAATALAGPHRIHRADGPARRPVGVRGGPARDPRDLRPARTGHRALLGCARTGADRPR